MATYFKDEQRIVRHKFLPAGGPEDINTQDRTKLQDLLIKRKALVHTEAHGYLVITKLHKSAASGECDISAAVGFDEPYALKDAGLRGMKPPEHTALFTNFFGGWLAVDEHTNCQVLDVTPTRRDGKLDEVAYQAYTKAGVAVAQC